MTSTVEIPAAAEDLTLAQVAVALQVSKSQVRKWCQQGKFRGAWNAGDGSRAGWRIPRTSIDEFRQSRQIQPVFTMPKELERLAEKPTSRSKMRLRYGRRLLGRRSHRGDGE